MIIKFALKILVSSLLLTVVLGGNWGQQQSPSWMYRDMWMQWYSNNLFKKQNPTCNTGPIAGPQVVHEWAGLEYDWPCDYVRQFYTDRGWYVPQVNVIGGIDVYKGDVYVTVYRVGEFVPSGLNKVLRKDGRSLLQPFPSLSFNEAGKCSNLQFPISTATDPLTGYMYVLDIGNVRNPFGASDPSITWPCPSKIVVLDLNNDGKVVQSYDFPDSVVPRGTSGVNDLVLDKVTRTGSKVRYAYISDPGQLQLVVFDFETGNTWAFKDESMAVVPQEMNITINGRVITNNIGIDGIALDADFEYVYYCSVGGFDLYQIPTSVLRNPNGDFAGNVRSVGKKLSQSDALIMGQESLFYGVESMNALYKWELAKDISDQNVPEGQVRLVTETQLAQDDLKFQWVDGVKIDEKGYLWFVTNRAQIFISGQTYDVSGAVGSNFRVNRVYVGEKSYLWRESLDCTGFLCRLYSN